jgi:glycosyltransferase involved in cell wall biosynthesis
MKICILTPRFPFPENGGDVLRINNICRYLNGKGHTIILVTFFDRTNKDEYKMFAQDIYDKVYYVKRYSFFSLVSSFLALIFNKPIQIGYYFSFPFLSVFKKVIKLEQPDLYISHLLRMVPYLNICNLQNKSIVEMTDALSRTYELADKSSGISFKKLIYLIEKKSIAKYEIWTIKKYRKCILVSEADREYLGNYESLYVYPNGVNCLEQVTPNYNKNKIVFVGNMRTLQNQDAVQFFAYDILPLVKQKIPQVIFHIIGAEPPAFIQEMADDKNIVVSGFVHSIEDEIKDAAIAVTPVRIAAGIQNKVLISMACGVPVVLTSLISVGIPELVSNENCIIADGNENFVNAVVSLIQSNEMRNSIGKTGYDMVRTKYSWNKTLKGYEEGLL